jgi:hypothetical protein
VATEDLSAAKKSFTAFKYLMILHKFALIGNDKVIQKYEEWQKYTLERNVDKMIEKWFELLLEIRRDLVEGTLLSVDILYKVLSRKEKDGKTTPYLNEKARKN